MPSYQDLETRIMQLERMVEFLMNVVQIPVQTSHLDPRPRIMPALAVYRATAAAGARLVAAPAPQVMEANGEIPENPTV